LFNVEIAETNSLSLLIIQEVTNDSKHFLFSVIKGLQTSWALEKSAIKSSCETLDQAFDLAMLHTSHHAKPTNLNKHAITAYADEMLSHQQRHN
jgi:hypothetical protein